jgi:hypothetical protein
VYILQKKRVIFFIFLIFSICSVNASIVDNKFSSEGVGSVMRNIDVDWQSEVGTGYVGGTSGSILLTAPGFFQYQTRDKMDATINNRYNQTGSTNISNGGVGSDSVSMISNSPEQYASVDHSWILKAAQIESAKFVSDANLSMGQEARWDGSGMYTRDVNYAVHDSGMKGSSVASYLLESSDHSIVSTNQTGGSITRPEFSYTDFSDSFIAKDKYNLTENQGEENQSRKHELSLVV